MAPILEVKNLQHIYSAGTPFEHIALKDVSFQVERGEFIGVIGHTGSGKSTLMRTVGGKTSRRAVKHAYNVEPVVNTSSTMII